MSLLVVLVLVLVLVLMLVSVVKMRGVVGVAGWDLKGFWREFLVVSRHRWSWDWGWWGVGGGYRSAFFSFFVCCLVCFLEVVVVLFVFFCEKRLGKR